MQNPNRAGKQKRHTACPARNNRCAFKSCQSPRSATLAKMPAPRAADRCDYVGTGSGGSLRHVKNAARTATPLRAGAIIAGRRRGCKGSLKTGTAFSGCLLCFQTASDAAAGCVAQATHAVCGGWGNTRIETFAPRRHSRAGCNPAGAYAMPCFSKRCRRPDKIPACAEMTEQEVLPAQLEKRRLRFRLLSTFSDGLRCCRRVCGSATHAVFWSGACVGLGKTKGRLKTVSRILASPKLRFQTAFERHRTRAPPRGDTP